jgi:uncharacterized protein (TIGR00251 family)
MPAAVDDDTLKIKVTAAPDKGAANAAVIEVLAKALGVAKSQVEILRGETSRQKQLGVHVDWSETQWQNTLAAMTHGEPDWFEILP